MLLAISIAASGGAACGRRAAIALAPEEAPAPQAGTAAAATSATADSAGERAGVAKERLAAGFARLEASDPKGALADLIVAAEFAPEAADAHYALGVAYFDLDDHVKARASLETALDRNPRHAPALEHLGRVEYAENRLEAALARWRAALDVEPDRASVRRLIEKAQREAPVEEKFGESFTQHFRLKSEGGGAADEALAKRIGEILERAYSDLGAALGQYPSRAIPVILYGDREFYEVTGSHGWVGGLFDGKIRIPVKDAFRKDPQALARVVTHEYTHACVYTLASRCPTWLQEGLAQHFEGLRPDRSELAAAARTGGLPSFNALATEFTSIREVARVRLVYGQSLAFVDYLIAQHGAGSVAALLRELGAGKSMDDATSRVYGLTLAELEAGWRGSLAP